MEPKWPNYAVAHITWVLRNAIEIVAASFDKWYLNDFHRYVPMHRRKSTVSISIWNRRNCVCHRIMAPCTCSTLKRHERKSKAYRFSRNTFRVSGRFVNFRCRRVRRAFGELIGPIHVSFAIRSTWRPTNKHAIWWFFFSLSFFFYISIDCFTVHLVQTAILLSVSVDDEK